MPCFPDKSLSARSASASAQRPSLLACQPELACTKAENQAPCKSVKLHSKSLSAALDPQPDANTPESVPLSQSVLHIAQIALGQIFGPVREEREPRWRRACLGSVADLDPLRRRAAPYHVTDELCKLVCRYPPPVCPPYSSRERQDLVHPCAR